MRLTLKDGDGYTVPPDRMTDAVLRLGLFEDWCDALEAELAAAPDELSRLRAEGKEKTVTYRETLGRKLFNTEVRDALARHGIRIDA